MFPCRFPHYGKGCQLECNCTEKLCNHISGCPNPAAETTTSKNSETHRGGSLPGEKKKLENLAVTKSRAYHMGMHTPMQNVSLFLIFTFKSYRFIIITNIICVPSKMCRTKENVNQIKV